MNDVWSSTDAATWTQATASAAWTARQSFSLIVYNSKMIVLHGHKKQHQQNGVLALVNQL